MTPVLDPLRAPLFTIGGTGINAFALLEFVIIFAAAYYLGKFAETSLRKLVGKHGSMRMESLNMFAKFLQWGILTVGVIIGLSVIGLPITHLAILVSALSVGIGFGLQTIVNNSIAGLILLTEKAVSIGDIIATPNGQVGRVNMITIRATRIVTPTGQNIIIPNANLIDKSFTNFTINARGVRKIYPFSIPYGCDFQRVKKIIEDAALQVPFCIKPDDYHEIECGITSFGNFGINVELVVWVDPIELMEPYRLESAFLNAINTACAANGIIMPGPNYVVNVVVGNNGGTASTNAQAGQNVPGNAIPTEPRANQPSLSVESSFSLASKQAANSQSNPASAQCGSSAPDLEGGIADNLGRIASAPLSHAAALASSTIGVPQQSFEPVPKKEGEEEEAGGEEEEEEDEKKKKRFFGKLK